jgi:hypothetical protein
MTNFFTYNKVTGLVLSSGSCSSPESIGDAEIGVVIDATATPGKQWYSNGILYDLPDKPAGPCTFDRVSGQWVREADAAIVMVRAQRNDLLSSSDWTQMPDVPLTPEQKTAWVTYRQQLRDFPATCDPENPVWPTPPA